MTIPQRIILTGICVWVIITALNKYHVNALIEGLLVGVIVYFMQQSPPESKLMGLPRQWWLK